MYINFINVKNNNVAHKLHQDPLYIISVVFTTEIFCNISVF